MSKKILLQKYKNIAGASTSSGELNDRYNIIKDHMTNIKRFNVRGRKMEFQVKQVPENVEPIAWIKEAINEVITYGTKHILPTDKVGITFCGKSFEERGPGWINFRDAAEVKFEDIWEMISKIFQSNSEGMCIKHKYIFLVTIFRYIIIYRVEYRYFLPGDNYCAVTSRSWKSW